MLTEFSQHLYRDLPISKYKIDSIEFATSLTESFCSTLETINSTEIVSSDELGVYEVIINTSANEDTLYARSRWRGIWSTHGYSPPLLILDIDEDNREV